MNYLKENLKKISLWRFIIVCVLLLGVPLEAYGNNSYANVQLSFQESMISIFGFPMNLYFIFLLLIADFGYSNNHSEMKTIPHFAFNLRNIFAICFLYFIGLALGNILTYILKTGTIPLSEEMINIQLYGLELMPASLAMGLSALLIYLYFVFITTVVFIINSICKKRPLGYLGVLSVFIVHVIVSAFCSAPTGFFPSDYVNLVSVVQIASSIPFSIAISVLYWLALIAAAGLVYYLINKSKSRKEGDLK